ncbi:MAG: thioredoxin domain-containing protein [Sphingobacteriaceae bacterium]
MSNRLQYATSPYLLQHAQNPVDWYPWGKAALQKARDENKLLLVSIGYSACHWCHVMEHECFEDEEVAHLMNRFFVCIKVDREERPDIDQIYMSAVQLMTGRGGWPLNCICLPDQRPIYGGTYFPKKDWMNVLLNLQEFFTEKPEQAEQYAVRLTEGVRKEEQLSFEPDGNKLKETDLVDIFTRWKRNFDTSAGGMGSAPKFPMPNNWQFLMRFAKLLKDDVANLVVRLTLEKMAFGGIYDQIGGGFSRYSVDSRWHVPHFEKMLYDNAQLVSLYAEGYTYCGDLLYVQIINETLEFISRELTSPEGGFYSALDADSEGVEGKFYTFTKTEVEDILDEDAALFCVYYHVTEEGNWEEEKTNIFFRTEEDEHVAEKLGMTVEALRQKIDISRRKILAARSQRVRPGLDNKILASWNGLMLKGYCDAYRVLNNHEYLEIALKNASFLLGEMTDGQGGLQRVYQSNLTLSENSTAFLDDYALVAEAFISLYEVTFDEHWLMEAKKLTDYAILHFYNPDTGLFFYTSSLDEALIARKTEIMDNVIPASNSVMARNLKKLGLLFNQQEYLDKSMRMLLTIKPQMEAYGAGYSNWAMLLLEEVKGTYEIAITGTGYEQKRADMEALYIPNKIILGGTKGSLPLLSDKFLAETMIFVCKDKTCRLPVREVAEAYKQIEA